MGPTRSKTTLHGTDYGGSCRSVGLNVGAKAGDCSRRVRVQLLAVLPHQHRRHNLWLQTVARTETGGRYEIDGCEFGSVKAHALGGVEYFAFAGIADENLKVLRAFFNHDPQSIPFGFVSLPVLHSFVSLS